MSYIILEILFIVIISAQTSSENDKTTKGLPVGQRSIANMSVGNYVYVDKTSYILEMIRSGQFFFVARPSKFGKTLFVDTLKEIFRGNKKYFKGTAIYKSDYEWQRSTVLHFDFSNFDSNSSKTLKNSLRKVIVDIGKAHNILVAGPSTEAQLKNLISKVADKTSSKHIVILVDDYDAPIIKNLAKPDLAEEMRQTLASFFDVIRNSREMLKFLFVTGVSKFSLSVSSRSLPNDNILQDLTLDAKYAAMMGYTEDEYKNNFQNDIRRISASSNKTKTKTAIINETQAWYKGYQFSKNHKNVVYNPWSVLNYLDHQEAADYWHRVSQDTSRILVDEIKKSPSNIIPVVTSKVCESKKSLTTWITSVENELPFVPFMFHAGYLTINQYNTEDGCYVLDFPNKEVREGFFNTVLQEFVGCDVDMLKLGGAAIIRQSLADFFFQAFVDQMNEFFKNSPTKFMTTLVDEEQKDVYRRLGVLMISEFCFPNSSSVSNDFIVEDSNTVEVVINLKNATYVLDLKLDKEPLSMKTSDLQQYGLRFYKENKVTVLMRINFSSKRRIITDWRSALLRGEEVMKKFLPKGVKEEEPDPVVRTSADTTRVTGTAHDHSKILTSVVSHAVEVTESTTKVEGYESTKTETTSIQHDKSTTINTLGPHSVITKKPASTPHPEHPKPKMSVHTTHSEHAKTKITGIHHDKSTITTTFGSTRHHEHLGATMSTSPPLKESRTSTTYNELTKTKTIGIHHDHQSTRITTIIPHSVPTSRLTSFAHDEHVKPKSFGGAAHGGTTNFKSTGIPHDEQTRIRTVIPSSISTLRPTSVAYNEPTRTRITPAPNEFSSSTTITTSYVSQQENHKKNESSTESPGGIRGFFGKLFNKFGFKT